MKRLGAIPPRRLGCATAALVALVVGGLLGWGVVRSSRRTSVEASVYLGESSAGLYPGSPVRLRGVTLGEVREVAVASDGRLIEVRCALWWDSLVELELVDPDEPLGPEQGPFAPPGFYAYLAEVGLTDLRILTLDFFPADRVTQYPLPDDAPWAHIPAVKSTSQTMKEFVQTRLAGSGPGLQAAIEQLERFEVKSRDLDGARIHARVSTQLDEIERLLEGRPLGEAAAERLKQGHAGLAELRAGVASVRSALGGSPEIRKRVEALIERLEQAQVGERLAKARESMLQQQVGAKELGVALLELRRSVRAASGWLRGFSDAIGGLSSDPDGLLVSPGAEGPP